MRTLFNVKGPDGKLRAQSTSRIHAKREIKWRLASGFPGPFSIEPIQRECSDRWGYGAVQRMGSKWPAAKHIEFLKRYAKGEKVNALSEYFDTSMLVICRKARELGFNYRIDDPRTFEKHRGRWTDREEELVNFMYDESGSLKRIAETIPRGEGAVKTRLNATAERLSTRSKRGRFIAKPGIGHRAVYPNMEDGG